MGGCCGPRWYIGASAAWRIKDGGVVVAGFSHHAWIVGAMSLWEVSGILLGGQSVIVEASLEVPWESPRASWERLRGPWGVLEATGGPHVDDGLEMQARV